MRIIISCLPVDAEPVSVLLVGCHAHSEFFFDELECDPTESAWLAEVPNRACLETFTELLATIVFKSPDFIRFTVFDAKGSSATRIFSLSQFHRYVFHES